MIEIDKDSKNRKQEETPIAAATPVPGRTLVWISVALAVISWILLMVTSGYIALAVGVAAIVVGFIAMTKSERNMRRVAITATIAASVLVVVLASFLIVIKIGLGV